MSQGADMSFIARLTSMSESEGGEGGGATPIASSGGNIFEVDPLATGPGETKGQGLSKLLEMSSSGEIKDIMNLLNSSTVLTGLFGNINAGTMLPTIDFFANTRNVSPTDFASKKIGMGFFQSGGGR